MSKILFDIIFTFLSDILFRKYADKNISFTNSLQFALWKGQIQFYSIQKVHINKYDTKNIFIR